MNAKVGSVLLGISVLICITITASEGQAKRESITFPLDCAGRDCPLLKGPPQTSGMRGGSVTLISIGRCPPYFTSSIIAVIRRAPCRSTSHITPSRRNASPMLLLSTRRNGRITFGSGGHSSIP